MVAAVPPFAFGAAAALSPRHAAGWSALVSQARIVITPESDYLARPLGLFLAAFGALLAYAATDPARHRAIVAWGAAVFFLRGVQRLVLSDDLHRLFGVPLWLNLLHCAYLVALALTLLILLAGTGRDTVA